MRKASFIPAVAVSIFLGVAVLLTACGGGGTSGTESIYLAGDDGSHGFELWSTDGSSAYMVTDINTGASGSLPSYLTTYDGNLYFRANDGSHGTELWAYDGSSAYMVTDIYTGSAGSYPWDLTAYNGNLYFRANDGINGYELWAYNGSSAYMVTDIYTGSAGSYPLGTDYYPDRFLEVNGKLIFGADNGTDHFQAYVLDGSTVEMLGGSPINTLGDFWLVPD